MTALDGSVSFKAFCIYEEAVVMNNPKTDVRKLTVLAMLTALAYVTVQFSSFVFPIKISGILSLEAKDCIIVIGAFLYGPISGVIMAVTVALLEFVTFSTTGWIGMLMNIISSVLFVLPASWIYKKKHTLKGALIGLLVGVVMMTGAMLLWNYLITPLYMRVERQMVVDMLLPVFLPFNLLKGGLNAAMALVLYKAISNVLRKMKLVSSETPQKKVSNKVSATVVIVAVIVAATLVLTALVWSGII